ncbi:MAG: DUF3027 domain-containing protein [Micrococcus sp.]|nr:DUF3027 domain-containing protein [Micrococcus sp.]
MTEEPSTEQPEREQPAAVRRRSPRRDDVLAAAVDEARAALAGLAQDGEVGEHLGVSVDDDRLMTHRFVAHVPGYRGWEWFAALARAPRSKHITVCEIGLTAGHEAIVAPAWVPYEDRVSDEERARMKAVAEGRDPDAEPVPEAESQSEGEREPEAEPQPADAPAAASEDAQES